uniref:Reverse transcriptase zinc-binding domain-containing protein n=1 Tax=Triticum urartu TaxID=4572 RepID=A0A8R7TBA7_TRIUA
MQSTVLSLGIRDSPRWRMTENGVFSVSMAYRMFFMASTRFAYAKPIWKSKAPPRCKFFMCLAVYHRCLTADNLRRRGW